MSSLNNNPFACNNIAETALAFLRSSHYKVLRRRLLRMPRRRPLPPRTSLQLAQKYVAEQTVARVGGVKQVVNEIEVYR